MTPFSQTWISDHKRYEAWDRIIYPYPNFNGATVEVWEWINHFIQHFTKHVITNIHAGIKIDSC